MRASRPIADAKAADGPVVFAKARELGLEGVVSGGQLL